MAKVLKTLEMNKCIGCFTCLLICAGVNRKNHSIRKSSIHIKTTDGMMSGRFVSVVCQACVDPPCSEVCRLEALMPRKGGGVTLDKKKCIGCSLCVDACMVRAIEFDTDERKPIVCVHCGVCARFCPHGCLIVREVPD